MKLSFFFILLVSELLSWSVSAVDYFICSDFNEHNRFFLRFDLQLFVFKTNKPEKIK
jgi:hypothetical protein